MDDQRAAGTNDEKGIHVGDVPANVELEVLMLAPPVIAKLLRAGYQTIADFEGTIKPLSLAREIGCTPAEAMEIISAIEQYHKSLSPSSRLPSVSCSLRLRQTSSHDPIDSQERQQTESVTSVTALDMLNEDQEAISSSQGQIITFCEKLDQLLDGGVHIGKITEFFGEPGVGKTQLAIQLAVDVQIPAEFGGVGGSAIYVDTEGSFVAERARSIAEALLSHLCSQITTEEDGEEGEKDHPLPSSSLEGYSSTQDPSLSILRNLSVESILDHIVYYRTHDFIEQIAFVHMLPTILEANKSIRLVIFDSVAFHFRNFEAFPDRHRILNSMTQDLLRAASTYRLAVRFFISRSFLFIDHKKCAIVMKKSH